MINRILPVIIEQTTKKPATNTFPVAHMPDCLVEALKSKETVLTPPVPVGTRYRGRLLYDKQKCIGCKLCMKVCPANATEYLPDEKKIQIHNDRCCFCAQCTEICPVKCLAMSDESLNSSFARKEEIIKDTGPLIKEIAEESAKEESAGGDKYVIDEANCIGCTKCARACPANAITGEVKKLHVIDGSACLGCGQCVESCPKNAIHIKA
jgi:formate hydrogenlyase subunit 6/NADH:ubiquinone oxidoreductase subunit I